MASNAAHLEFFIHIRIIIGMILGLSLARLINGIARFIQHPKDDAIYPIHLGWSVFMLLAIIHFWWFEFGLTSIEKWQFGLYLFVIFYAFLFAMICAILFPDSMKDYSGFEHYFRSRSKWFYGLLALMFVVDTVDTLIKGMAYFHSLGIEYAIRQLICALSAVIAMFWTNKVYHTLFVSIVLIYEVIAIVRFHPLS